MNEFIIIDSEGVTHWLITCPCCYGLVEQSMMDRHMIACVHRTVAS
jgi:hypothetical protein